MNLATALAWSYLGEIAAKMMTPIIGIILAMLLSPEDFGVVAAATMVVSFTQTVWEAGLGKSLIQLPGAIAPAASTAFWINLALGLAVMVLLLAGADVLAISIFKDPRVAPVLRVMSLLILLSAASATHLALLQREMRFKTLFWIRLPTIAIPGLASIPLAFSGMGYWALVVGALAGQAAQLAVLWWSSGWRPSATFDRTAARQLLGFGKWVALTGLLAWFYTWADALIVGMYLGPHELGLYRTGGQLVALAFGALFAPILPVLYSALARQGGDLVRIRQVMVRVVHAITLASLPLAALIAINAGTIATLALGPAWTGVETVLVSMALIHGISWIVGANGEAYRAAGLPDRETFITTTALGAYLAGYLLSIRYGFEPFVWTRLGLAFGALGIHLAVMRRSLGIGLGEVLMPAMRISAACAACWVLAQAVLGRHCGWSGQQVSLGASLAIIATVMAMERGTIMAVFRTLVRSRASPS